MPTAKTVRMIGITPDELPWIRLLVHLLRHPDAGVPELARQALLYLTEAAGEADSSHQTTRKGAG